MKSRSKDLSKTTWYDKPDRLNSRHSLETDEEISTDEEVFENVQDVENTDGLGEGRSGGRLINKLFHSTPSLAKKEYAAATVRPRAPTNEKLEKYKFMLINIGELIFKSRYKTSLQCRDFSGFFCYSNFYVKSILQNLEVLKFTFFAFF